MANKIDGRMVMVVGASRGLGLEFVRQLAAKGCNILASHRQSAVPKGLSELVEQYGNQVTPIIMDVQDEQSVVAAAETVKKLGVKIDCLINNAGIIGEARGENIDTITSDSLLQCFVVNTIGPVLVAKHFHKLMRMHASPPSVLANMSSKVGSVADNSSGGNWAYRISKAAQNMASRNLAHEIKPEGIATVVLHPGYVRTDMTGGQGLIDVDESVKGMIEEVEKTTLSNFRFVDYKHEIVPW